MPYVKAAEDTSDIPQGDAWVDTPVEKLFCTPTSGQMDMYPDKVTEIQIIATGQGRLKVVYEDGDSETCDIPNVISWIQSSRLLEPEYIWLEKYSTIERAGLLREAHVYLTMMETLGRLRSEAQEIQKKAPTFVAREASSFKYKEKQQKEDKMEDDLGAPAMKAGTKAAFQDDAKTMENLEAKGQHQLAQAQAKQARAYANRKRPRNKREVREEALEVGAHCRISPMLPHLPLELQCSNDKLLLTVPRGQSLGSNTWHILMQMAWDVTCTP